MFDGFSTECLSLDDGIDIHLRIGGTGPPLLLLHGYPQTHVIWHKVAPSLAKRYTVVAADLRGYGDSSKQPYILYSRVNQQSVLKIEQRHALFPKPSFYTHFEVLSP